MLPIRAICASVFIILTCVGEAAAQAPRSHGGRQPSSQEPSSPEYRSAIEEALSEFEAGRYEEARVLFLRAHAIEPNARTLRGIGNCAFEVSDYVAAIVAFEEALASDRRPLDARMRQQTEQLVTV